MIPKIPHTKSIKNEYRFHCAKGYLKFLGSFFADNGEEVAYVQKMSSESFEDLGIWMKTWVTLPIATQTKVEKFLKVHHPKSIKNVYLQIPDSMTIEITESAARSLLTEAQEQQIQIIHQFQELEHGFRKIYHVHGMILTEVYNYIPKTEQFYLTDING